MSNGFSFVRDIQRIEFDYGYDLYIQTFDDEGYVENGFCLMQLKATDRITWVAQGTECVLVLERRDWEMWQSVRIPATQVLDESVVGQMQERKNQILLQKRGEHDP
jgi:hypothetical protein